MRQSNGTDVFYNTGSDVSTVIHHIKDSDIEEVGFETMMTALADENPDVFTHEEVGIILSSSYLKQLQQQDWPNWSWYPLLMERLEAAAASREEREAGESIH